MPRRTRPLARPGRRSCAPRRSRLEAMMVDDLWLFQIKLLDLHLVRLALGLPSDCKHCSGRFVCRVALQLGGVGHALATFLK
eukprot:1213191-Pyramimonas_sp.AAC.1